MHERIWVRVFSPNYLTLCLFEMAAIIIFFPFPFMKMIRKRYQLNVTSKCWPCRYTNVGGIVRCTENSYLNFLNFTNYNKLKFTFREYACGNRRDKISQKASSRKILYISSTHELFSVRLPSKFPDITLLRFEAKKTATEIAFWYLEHFKKYSGAL